MWVRRLELSEFRCWEALALAFEDHAVALVGPNASGKTSILEAVWYCASLASHRAASDATLVRAGRAVAVVRAEVEVRGRTSLLELEIATQGRARARLGGAPVPRRRDVLGTLRAVIFAPERVAVVRGDPSERRRFIDEVLVQLHPRYHAVIREFERALRQRNALLRESEGLEPRGLEAWNEAVAAPGGDLCAGRAEAAAALAGPAGDAFGAVADGSRLEVRYAPNVSAPSPATAETWAAAIRERLRDRRSDELTRRMTLAGPHRDDLEIAIDGLPARTHASQGEAWLATLCLGLGAHAALANRTGDLPVLLLDDAFSSLDPNRRERIAAAIPEGTQVVATASDAAELPASLCWRTVSVDGAGVRGHG